ncbi:hypothetical protein V493_01979 [Pseudogymnoascus sp. VKM F-4281 (FW-2241)]|nr:hypothetical protein V493_01979 [Pseudogymnoascus sp. VKM F-4281 (FW-2241)]
MPSPNSPRDDSASDCANSTENPFVKFRNAVDYHVGSVLQGIIGLPTILSGGPNSGNGRWAELEGNSHRNKNDSQRQSPRNGATENISNEEGKIPVKKFHGESFGGRDASGPSDHDDDDEYDIFSAFDDSFIDRVKRSTKGHPWLELQPGEKFRWRYESPGCGVQKCIQQRFHASLMDLQTTRGPAEPAAFQEKSVVPYLLFSPYSPLNLTSLPGLRSNDDAFGLDTDQFTYCDAFEDLLRVSAGKPMRDVSGHPFDRMLDALRTTTRPDWPHPRYGIFPGGVANMSTADIGMMWMGTALVDENVLQEDPIPEQVHFSPLWGEIHTMMLSPIALVLRNFVSHIHEYRLSQSDVHTEQDMYERFFTPGSEVAASSKRVGKTLEEIFALGRDIKDVFNDAGDADFTEQSEAAERPSSSATHIKSSRTSDLVSPIESASSNVPRNERVISSSTSTTQHTDEDGTVRTKIIIEKHFEDGRKSVTETSHVQSPSGDKKVQRNGYEEPANGKLGKDNEKKKGWFWN